MTRTLIMVATFGLAVSGAAACDFQHNAAAGTDDTKVASISADKAQNMSAPVSQPTSDGTPVIVGQQPATAAPAKAQ